MRIVLAEDDALVAKSVARSLCQERFDVILACDGEEALRTVRSTLPSVLLLDLVMPRLDGLAVLSVLPSLRLERKPRVIALSPFRDEAIARRAVELGASKVLPKPLELKRLRAAIDEGGWMDLDAAAHARILHLLGSIGISSHTRGGLYLLEAITIAAHDFEAIERLRDRIYAPIAIKNATKAENVERLIRHAIEGACTRGRIDVLHGLFGQTMRRETGKPTNAEFIAMLAENVRLHARA